MPPRRSDPQDPTPVPGDDVREPPLPSDRPEQKLPSPDELRKPEEGGGNIKEKL